MQNKNEEIESEYTDESLSFMEKPFDPTKINIETKTPSLDTLIKRIERKSIQMDTTTYFQRKDDLWDKTKQSRLIESILIRFPLPAFFFDATDDNNWLVVDGLQRLSSIRNFCVEADSNKKLILCNLEFLSTLNGKSWNDIGVDLQRIIEEAQVVIYKIMPGTPTDVKFNIFKRINTGGLVLEAQEIRHALFQGIPAKFIDKLSKLDSFLQATNNKISPNRMLDRDFANRFLSYYLLGVSNYGSKDFGQDLDTYMSNAMAKLYDKTELELDQIITDFDRAMNIAHKIFGNDCFRKPSLNGRKLPINKAIFDSLSTQIAILTKESSNLLLENKAKFKIQFDNMFANNNDFVQSVTSSTGDKKRTIYRHEAIQNLIKNTITEQND